MTIDIVLQQEIQEMFRNAVVSGKGEPMERLSMHGAAVVIDIPTGQVRALVSAPSVDLNRFDELYPKLVRDDINAPLLNRATQVALETGSTIKPVVGLSGITEGVIRVDEGIECTGYLVLGGHKYSVGRCWVASRYASTYGAAACAHHPWPYPHQGVFGNPDGFLVFADALERSCNVYFETVADRLGMARLAGWYHRFGLGRKTGLGIAESAGRVPNPEHVPPGLARMTTWFAGIGQGQVAATPIQMANVAATIARDGVWLRPTLLMSARPVDEEDEVPAPDRVDLKLNPAAIKAAQDGIIRVVNGRAGTGDAIKRDDVLVAGKTGTAQAAKLSVPLRDERGQLVRDAGGRVQRRTLEPGTRANANPEAPWYRGWGAEESINHAWYIGYAPADNPRIAFAVMVRIRRLGWGDGRGNREDVLESCVEHGYVPLGRKGE